MLAVTDTLRGVPNSAAARQFQKFKRMRDENKVLVKRNYVSQALTSCALRHS